MALELKIPITADATSAISGLDKTADSASKLFKEFVTGKATLAQFEKQLGEDIAVSAAKAGGGLKSLEVQYKTLINFQERSRQKWGEEAEIYKDIAASSGVLKAEIDKIKDANKKASEAEKARVQALKEQEEETARVEKMTQELIASMNREALENFAGAIDDINREMREMEAIERNIQQTNAQNANLGFMMLTGDEVGVATHTLKEYEQELKNVISETGVMSTETQKAYKKYADQKTYVDRLVRSTKESALAQKDASTGVEEYTVAVKNAAPAVDKFAVATKELDKTSKGYLSRLVTLTKNILIFQLIMGPIRSAISGVKNTLKESVNVAAEAEQTYSKLATVFDGFEKSASRAATSLASALGVAKSTASGALSTVGDLLQAQGMGTAESLSTASRWTSQFYDIINFKDINMSLEEFAQNFMSGAAGNLRNFRTFGSIVKESAVNARLAAQGLDKLTGSELELAKMTTRAEMALEQQKNAMGATSREWDTTLSVTRRLNEAWKEYKENLGDTLISFVKPIKRDITDLLDRVNKVKRAAKELEGGAVVSSVYDIRNNEKDRAAFKKDLLTEFNSYEGDFNRYANGTITSSDTLAFEALDYVMRMYAASLEDVTNILGNKLPEAATEYLKSLEATRNAEIELQKAIEGRKTQIATASDRYNAFAESLLGISGVSFNASSFSDATGRYSQTEGGTAQLLGIITSTIFSNVDAALASIKSSDLAETWGGVIAGALDELDKGELLQGRIDSVRQLFENTWNEFLPDGFTEEEKAKLEEIKATYKGYVDELEEYNTALRLEKIAESENNKAIQRAIANLGYLNNALDKTSKSAEKTATDYRLDIFKEIAESYGLLVNGQSQANNFDVLKERKKYQFDDGSYGTVYSMTHFDEATQAWYVLPEIVDGVFVDVEGALENFYNNAIYLGKFATEEEAEQYAVAFHQFDEFISDNIDLISELADKQEKYNKGLEVEKALKEAVSTAQEYAESLKNFGLDDKVITYNNLKDKEKNALSGAEGNAYSDAIRDFVLLTSKEAAAAFSDLAYEAELTTMRMTNNEKALYELDKSYETQKAILEAIGADTKDLTANYEGQRKSLIALQKEQAIYNKYLERQALLGNAPTTYQTQLAQFGMSDRDLLVQQRNELASKHDPLWVAIQREIDAFDELEKKTRELALAEAWAATGERALGATGTLGSVVSQFTDDEGDIWSDIVNALLTIMENTEGWSDIAATLDQIFEMFEPVVDGFINLILSLPWEDIIYMLKVVATVLVTIMGIIRGIQEVFKWLWDNIKVALNNVKEAILHPISGGDQRSFRSFDNLRQTIVDVAADVKEEYERIWAVDEKIERNTRKDDVLKTLKELYAAGIINENQFYAGARVIQKDKVFDPVPAGSPKYLSSPSQTSTTISYGGVTLQFNGGDTEEIKRWLLNLFNGNGIPYNTAIGG